MKTRLLHLKDIDIAKEIINNNGVIAFPTETVFGLGVRYNSFLACDKLFELKQRPAEKAVTMMLYDVNDIEKYAEVDEKINRVIKAFMPGAITIVLKKKQFENDEIFNDTIGIRIPDDAFSLELLSYIKTPLLVTSANLSGNPSLYTYQSVLDELGPNLDACFLEDAKGLDASTVVGLYDDEIRLFRNGPISLDDIERVFYNE